jgi:hypothetical protein
VLTRWLYTRKRSARRHSPVTRRAYISAVKGDCLDSSSDTPETYQAQPTTNPNLPDACFAWTAGVDTSHAAGTIGGSVGTRGKLAVMEIPEPLKHCYARTLRIVTRNGTSSSFVMDYKGQRWVVTGIHCVEDQSGHGIPFAVLDQNGVDHSGLCERVPRMSLADVAVFRLRAGDLDFGPPLEPYSPHDVRVTQDLYFLGYPELGPRESYHLAYTSPVTPFLKKAMVSGAADYPGEPDPHNVKAWVLDGMSSGGFSGGPVIIHEQEPEGYRIFGVISSYVPAYVSVTPRRPSQLGAALPAPNGRFVKTNMGLMTVFDIRYAKEAIDAWLGSQAPE